jgi:DNA polymerase/3'-5' exonuclease PolX
MNKEQLVDQFNDLGKHENNKFKKISYFNAARIIKNMNEDEFNNRTSFVDIKGIGKIINEKIMQFKNTGFIEKWKKLKDNNEI